MKILLILLMITNIIKAQNFKIKVKEYSTFKKKAYLKEYEKIVKIKSKHLCNKQKSMQLLYLQEELIKIEKEEYIKKPIFGQNIQIGNCYENNGLLKISIDYGSFFASKRNRYFEPFYKQITFKKNESYKIIYFKRKTRSVKLQIIKI